MYVYVAGKTGLQRPLLRHMGNSGSGAASEAQKWKKTHKPLRLTCITDQYYKGELVSLHLAGQKYSLGHLFAYLQIAFAPCLLIGVQHRSLFTVIHFWYPDTTTQQVSTHQSSDRSL